MYILPFKRFRLLFFILFLSLPTTAQNLKKYHKKAENKYTAGSYKSSYNTTVDLYEESTKKGIALTSQDLVRLFFNRALAAEAIYRYKEVDSLITLGLAELNKIPAEYFNDYATAYKQLARVYFQTNNFAKAIDYQQKAIQLLKSRSPQDSSLRKDIETDLANSYLSAGYYNEALTLVNRQNNYRLERINEKLTIVNPETGEKKTKPLNKKEVKQRKKEYAELINLKSAILFKKGNYASLDSALVQNQAWMKKNTGKRNFVYRDYLITKALSEKNKNNLSAASKYFEQAKKYTKFKPSEKKGMDIQEELIQIYFVRGKKHEAIVNRIKFERKARYSYGKNSLAYSRYRLQEVKQLYADSKFDKADKKLSSIFKTPVYFPENHSLRYNLLDMEVKLATKRSNFDIALDSLNKIIAIKKLLYGENSPEYHKEQLRLADFYANYSNNFTTARAIQEKSFTKYVSPQLAIQSKEYIGYLQQIANLYELMEKYDLAIKYLNEAGNNIKTYYGADNTDYASDLEKTASVLLKKGDFVKAEEVIKQAVAIFQNNSAKSSALDKSATYLTLAKLYNTLGMYQEAEDALDKAAKLSKKSRQSNAGAAAKSSDELAGLYIKQGRYNEAEDLLTSTLEIKEKKLGKDNRELISTLNSLGNLFLITGQFSSAEKYIRRSMSISSAIFTENSVRYTESLRLLESLYKELGDFKKAEETALQVLNIQKGLLGNNHIDVAASLTQLALIKIYINGGNAESEKLLYNALSIVKFNLGDKNPQYAEQLKYLALLFIETKKYDKADSMLNTANAIWVEKLGRYNVNSAEVAMLKGNLYILKGEYKLAETNYLESRVLYAHIFSEKHPGYVKATSKLARAYYINKDYTKALKMLNESAGSYLEFTEKYFPSLSFSEKSKFWNQIKDDFEFYNSLALKVMDKNPAITGSVYDNIMATKALLLSSSIKLKQRILNSKDEKLITKYNDWTSKKQYLISILSMSREAQQQSGTNPDQLEKEINQLEKELSESSELFAQSFEKKSTRWKDLQKILKPDEYAVELLRFRYFDKTFTDSIIYAALIVSGKHAKAPQYVTIGDGKKMETRYLKYYKNVVINKIDDDDYSYNIYWKPIKDKLPDNATIYLSSEGVYNELNIESFKAEDGSYPIDKNLIIPVSNTKDLLTKSHEAKTAGSITSSKAVLLGNPTFYASASKIASVKSEDRSIAKSNIYESASKNVISQLPGTEIEVNEINKLFESKGWSIKKYTNAIADEDSIKNIRSPRILHIATHGYFNADVEQSTEEGLSSTESEFSQNPLLRSGLLMKGAGDVLKTNNSLKINSENGILTAYEAMDLNLDNTDLVVLSACETGKGEVQIGEGVFGLQRAILVAGANTMVMTLFKVNDDITKELMISFYKSWLQTGELRKSFTDAKKLIKEKYKYPIYWGSFVMVGLE